MRTSAKVSRFRELVDLACDWHWEQDERFRFRVFSNPEAMRSGVRIGVPLWESPGQQVGEAEWRALRADLEAGLPFKDFLYAYRDWRGELRYLSLSGQPMYDDEGELHGWRGIARDVTERHREEALLRLEHLVSRILADADAKLPALQEVIAAVCETEGWEYGRFWQLVPAEGVLRFVTCWYAAGSVVGPHVLLPNNGLFHLGEGLVGRVGQSGEPMWVPDLTRQPHMLNPQLAAGIVLRGGCLFPVKVQGHTIGVMTFLSPYVREPDRRLLAAFRTIGNQVGQFLQRMQREEEVARLNAELEERVRQRTLQLQAAQDELTGLSQAIAHDLRAPLTSINGFAHLLQEATPGLSPAGSHYLDRVVSGVRQLGELTEAMLALAQLSQAALDTGDVDLAALVRECVQQLQRREPQRQVVLVAPPHLFVQGDARLLGQVVLHLVGNAWKFSQAKASVWIELGSVAAPEGGRAYFVRDRGIGFDMAHASRLFTAFQRLHAEPALQGTGIGLALVRTIIARHGGRVWAEATPGAGATIYFTLP
jgi:signal transduction histidine kinase